MEGLRVMKISDELFFNIVKDWEKKDVSTEEKGRLIKAYLKEKKISQRELAKQLNIPHSTVHDWVSGRQMVKYYKDKLNEVDTLLDRLLYVLSRKEYIKTEKTIRLVTQLRIELEKVELK
jgi:transcriptional regulator with XRE-family HTH domain